MFYNEHTLQMKKMPPLDETFIKDCFDHNGLIVFTDEKLLYNYIRNTKPKDYRVLKSQNEFQTNLTLQIYYATLVKCGTEVMFWQE